MLNTQYHETSLPPELSALEASLSSLEPQTQPGRCEAVKATALLRLFETAPPPTGEKLIETIVKTGAQEITLSLREYVKSARLVAGLYGSAVGVLVGLLLGVGLMLLVVKPAVREVYHVPVFVNDVMKEK
jgi:hypothetical protein